MGSSVRVAVKGVFEVDDGTGGAVLVATGGEVVKNVLGVRQDQWEELVAVARQEGGLLYRQRRNGDRQSLLDEFVASALKSLRYFACAVRPFNRTDETVKLFCLYAWSPTAKMINEAFEASLDNDKMKFGKTGEKHLVLM